MDGNNIEFNRDKPIILFTSFWDANFLAKEEYFLVENDGQNKLIWIDDYSTQSIALMSPEKSKIKYLTDLQRLDIFCPTYTMLMAEKSKPDWPKYTKEFKSLISSRKHEIVDWVDSLVSGHIYILCCWEATCEGTNCHRR